MLPKRIISVENRSEETTEGRTWRIGKKHVFKKMIKSCIKLYSLFVCLFVCPIITHEPLDRFA